MWNGEEESLIEPDAAGTGTPNAQPRTQQRVFPWDNPNARVGQASSSGSSQQGSASGRRDGGDSLPPQDGDDSLLLMARITMFLAHPNCDLMIVPGELRDLIRKQVGRISDLLNDRFLQRLNDLKVITEDFLSDLKEKEVNDRYTPFLEYLYRKGMVSVLNFTKALHEDGKYDAVRVILGHIRSKHTFDKPEQKGHSGDIYAEMLSMDNRTVDVKPGRYYDVNHERNYKMSSHPRGYVLLINNENFDTDLAFREGSEVDAKKLTSLFTQLSFKLYNDKRYNDLTRAEMRSLIEEFSQFEDHRNVDASVVIILSHGEREGMFGTDGHNIKDEDVLAYFTASKCPALAEKPKIFLFVACQGSELDLGHKIQGPAVSSAFPQVVTAQSTSEFRAIPEIIVGSDGAEVGQGDRASTRSDVPAKHIPDNVDFITVYATVPGYRSLRHKYEGTWFVQDFVEVVANEAHNEMLLTLVCEVNNRMSKRTHEGEKQSLVLRSTLRKTLFFNPGF